MKSDGMRMFVLDMLYSELGNTISSQCSDDTSYKDQSIVEVQTHNGRRLSKPSSLSQISHVPEDQ